MPVHLGNTKSANNLLRQSGLVAAFVALALTPAAADEFHLATGKIVRGAVISQTATQFVLQTEVGTIQVKKSDVVRTVDTGTTPVEIEGDIALNNGNLDLARTRYTQALNQAVAGSTAAQRIQTKMDKLSSDTQRVAVDQFIGQFNQARALLEARQYETVEVLLEQLSGQISPADPLSSEILQMQAQLHYGKGIAALDAVKIEIAQQELQAAIAADPAFYPAYLSLGDALLGNSATDEQAVEYLERGIRVAGDRISEQQKYAYQYKVAQKYFDRKDYAKAAAMYAALIPARDRYPAYADALDRAVESYVKMGEENLSSDFRETITNLNNALKLNPSNQKALFLLGRIYLDIGQVENAIVSLQRLVALNESYEEANHYLGRAYFQANDNASALRYMSVEIDNHPDNYFSLVDRAEVYIEQGNNTAAQADLTAAKLINPDHWRAYYLTGLIAYNEEDYEQASTSLMKALDSKRTAMPVHLLMSRVLVAQNQLDGARQWLEQVANRLENVENLSYTFKLYRANALTQLGEIALKQNSPRQAENYLKSALVMVPDYAPALVAMADTKLLLANDAYVSASKEQLFDEAEAYYLKAIKKDPAFADYYSKLGRFYQTHKKDNEKAITYYNMYADKGGTSNRVNVWLVEAGGASRPELETTTLSTIGATTGTMMATSTVAMTTGPMGSMVTTSTAVTAPQGTVLPVDAMMAEMPGAATTTTTATTVQPTPAATPIPAVPPAPGAGAPPPAGMVPPAPGSVPPQP